jgi:hypothetical protein
LNFKIWGGQLQCSGESCSGSARHGRRQAADAALATSTAFHPATVTTGTASRSPAASFASQRYKRTVTATVAVWFHHRRRHRPPFASQIRLPCSTVAISISPIAPPSPCEPVAPLGVDATAQDRRGAFVFHFGSPPSRVSSATVASRLRCLSASTDHGFVFVVCP